MLKRASSDLVICYHVIKNLSLNAHLSEQL